MLLRSFVRRAFTVGRLACGLLLVLAATADPVYAHGPVPGPELDPGSMASALTLLAGGLLLLRRRK